MAAHAGHQMLQSKVWCGQPAGYLLSFRGKVWYRASSSSDVAMRPL
jgi:hypothetical protein